MNRPHKIVSRVSILAFSLSAAFLVIACQPPTGSQVTGAALVNPTATATPTSTTTPTPMPSGTDPWENQNGWNLVWQDEFNGSSLNASNWVHDLGDGGWGNHELETYQQQNAVVSGGLLTITAKQNSSPSGTTYTSSRIKTQGLKSFNSGRVEARIKLPYGQGIWPAFWMLGANIDTASWPACGEIDIMEMIGGANSNNSTLYGTIHYDNGGHASTSSSTILSGGKFADDFHVFGVDWSSTKIVWTLDGQAYKTVNLDPTQEEFVNKPFFLLFNMAVGGDWPGSPDGSTVFPQTMQVDWVRIYQQNGAPATEPGEATSALSSLNASTMILWSSSSTPNTPLAVSTWSASWAPAPIANFTTATGSAVLKKLTFTNNASYTGTEGFQILNIAGHAHLHLDYWTSNGSNLGVKIVSYPTGSWNASTNKELDLGTNAVSQGAWHSLDLDFSNIADTHNISQILFENSEAATFYLDHLYFY